MFSFLYLLSLFAYAACIEHCFDFTSTTPLVDIVGGMVLNVTGGNISTSLGVSTFVPADVALHSLNFPGDGDFTMLLEFATFYVVNNGGGYAGVMHFDTSQDLGLYTYWNSGGMGTIYIGLDSGYLDYSYPLVNSTMYKIFVIRNAANITVYVDCSPDPAVVSPDASYFVGTEPSFFTDNSAFELMSVDLVQIRVWDYALSSDDFFRYCASSIPCDGLTVTTSSTTSSGDAPSPITSGGQTSSGNELQFIL